MKYKVTSGIMLTLLSMGMLTLALDIQPAQGIDEFRKILIFEDDFEEGIAAWWNEIHGTPTLSTAIVHSGNYSYVTDEDYDSLAYHWFNTSMIGEMEGWFYDSMHEGNTTSTFGTNWAPSYVFAVQMRRSGDYELYYAYRLGTETYLSSHLRSIGWHKVNIIHEPERAYILLDGDLLVEIDHQVSFKGFNIGDNWIYNTTSFTYYDDIMVWRYVSAVGGISIPVNKLELLVPYLGSALLLAATVVIVVYVKKRKRKTEANS